MSPLAPALLARLTTVTAAGALLAPALAPVAADASTRPGLVAAYGFSDGHGSSAADSSGHARDATLVHTVWVRHGRYGGAVALDGPHSLMQTPGLPAMSTRRGITVEGWIRPARGGSAQVVFAGVDRSGRPALRLELGRNVLTASAGRGSRAVPARSSSSLPLHRWKFVAATFGPRAVSLFVDGRRVSRSALRGRHGRRTSRMTLGAAAGGGRRLRGRVDNVRIYRRALSRTRIVSDMRTAVATPPALRSVPTPPGASPPAPGPAPAPPAPASTPVPTPTPTPSPAVSMANLWVDGRGGSCTRRPTPGDYLAGSACKSLDAAFQAASPGDTVLVRGGSYGAQTIPVRPLMSAATRNVTFQPAPGASVAFTGNVTILGSHVTLRAGAPPSALTMAAGTLLDIDPGTNPTSGSDRTHAVTVEDMDGRNFHIGAVAGRVTIHGGDWGPSVSCSGGDENVISGVPAETPNGAPAQTPNGITLDGLTIHGQNSSDPATCHTGGLLFQGGTNIVLRNSRFYRNMTYDVMWDDFNDAFHTAHYVIENNWFGAPVSPLPNDGQAAEAAADLQMKWHGSAGVEDWLIRYNSFTNGVDAAWDGEPAGWSQWRFVANTGGSILTSSGYNICRGAGQPSVTIAYNAFVGIDNFASPIGAGPDCGDPRNRVLGHVTEYGDLHLHPYVGALVAQPDYHLKANTPAQDLVTGSTPDLLLGTDIDGDARPMGAARDAGADERP